MHQKSDDGYLANRPDVTEQRILAAIVESSEDAIIASTPAGVILTWNRGAEVIFGYDADDTIGKHLSMLMAPDRLPDLAFFAGQISHGVTLSQYPSVCRRKDGRNFHASVTGAPLRNSAGEVEALSAILRDVSKQKDAEEALIESEERFRVMADGCPTPMWMTDAEGGIQFTNRVFREFCGAAHEEVEGHKWQLLIHPDDIPEFIRETNRAVRTQTPFHSEARIRRADGEWRWLVAHSEPRFSPGGEFLGHVGLSLDFTERKRMEDALRESDESHRRQFTDNSVAMVLIDPADGRIIDANDAAIRFYGYPREQLLKMGASDINTHAASEVCEALASVAQGRGQLFQRQHRLADGSIRDVEISSSRIQFGGRTVVHAIVFDITARKRAEEALRESEERYRLLFDGSRDAMMTAAPPSWRFTSCNAATVKMFGACDASEFTSLNPSELSPERQPDGSVSADKAREAMERALREGSHLFEWMHRRLDGTVFPASVLLTKMEISGREFLQGIVRDITASKLAEGKLRESEDRFRIMADGCPTMIWVADADGRSQFVNRAYREFCGVTSQEAEGGEWQGVIHPDDLPGFVQAFESAVREHASFRAEVRVRRADGEWRWVAPYAEPRFSESGEYMGHVGLSPDITERKRAEEEFRKIAAVVENSDDFIVMASLDGKVQYLNRAGCELVGIVDPHEAVGRDFLDFHPEAARGLIRETILPAAQSGAAWRGELQLLHFPTGTPVDTLATALLIRRPGTGEPVCLAAVMRDITSQKRAEAALRTAKREAEAASVSKSRFLANMSHEIRTPMNGVIGMLQLLEETELTEEQQRYATVAQNSGHALLSLINDILDLSKIEARKLTLEKLIFNLPDTVDDIVQLMRVQASAKGLDIHLRVSPEVPMLLRGDAHRLRQVVTNLAANAIKFTERGEVVVDVALERQCDRTATVRVTITDTGIGIRPEQVAALFLPFVQADSSTTRKYGGTGLGLAICKQLVAMMGGTIGVSGREGPGSAFSFTAVFELVAPNQKQPVSHRADRHSGTPVGTTLTKRTARILAAEDNTTNREVILAQLKKLGYQASTVTNGADAVEAVERGSFDLVLMDCQMPVMDGFEATRRIRTSSHPGIPIIAITADAMSDDRDRCLSVGMYDYLSKPVELGPLEAVLTKWLPENGAGVMSQKVGPSVDQEARVIFNSESLLRRLGGDRQIAGIVVKGFLEEAPSQLNNLRARLAEADASGTRLQAHSLKGSAATVGAEGLHALALAMERAGKAGQLDQCGALLPRVVEEFERFKSTLERAGWV